MTLSEALQQMDKMLTQNPVITVGALIRLGGCFSISERESSVQEAGDD